MKKTLKLSVLTSLLGLGLFIGGASAHMTGTPHHDQPVGPGMMGPGMMGMMGPGMMGPGMMGMMGPGMMNGCWMGGPYGANLTADQWQTFLGQTADIRKQMMETRFAYMEALRNPKTTPQDLASLQKKMVDLRTKMIDKMNAVQ